MSRSNSILPRMASARRIEQINILVKEELSRIISREIDLMEYGLITITRVDTSRDALYATVYLSLLGVNPAELLSGLTREVYHIQQRLNHSLAMRPVPKIRFALDREEMRREGLERSLAQMRQGEKM